MGQVLVHVEAGGERVGNRGQHHRQRQGNDRHHGFPPAPAQVGPGHALKGCAALGFADLLPLPRLFRTAALGVAHGLHRGDLRRHAARTGAGEEHGQQGEQRRSNENQGVEGDEGVLVAQLGHDDRGELVADDKAQEQSNGDADKAEKQGLLPDDAFDLLAGGADGFQKAVKPDIVGDGNLEDVVDNQVAGEDNQQQQNHNGDQRGDIKAVGKLGPGVAPVDADFQVILPLGVVVLIAVVLQDLKDVLLDLEVAFEHHVQVPFSGHGVGVPAALGAELLGGGAGQEHIAGHQGAVVLPPSREGEGPGDQLPAGGVFVKVEGNGEFRAHLRLHPQKGQNAGVRGGLVGALPGEGPFDWLAEVVGRGGGLQVGDLHMGFVEGRVHGHAHEQPGEVPLNQRV